MKNAALFLLALTIALSALAKKTTQKNGNLPSRSSADTTSPSAIDGVERLGKKPLVLIDGVEHDKEILYKISAKCIRGNSILNPNNGEHNMAIKEKMV